MAKITGGLIRTQYYVRYIHTCAHAHIQTLCEVAPGLALLDACVRVRLSLSVISLPHSLARMSTRDDFSKLFARKYLSMPERVQLV